MPMMTNIDEISIIVHIMLGVILYGAQMELLQPLKRTLAYRAILSFRDPNRTRMMFAVGVFGLAMVEMIVLWWWHSCM